MCSNLCFILTKQEYRFQVYQEKKQFVGEWPPLPSRLQAELAGSGRSSGGFLLLPGHHQQRWGGLAATASLYNTTKTNKTKQPNQSFSSSKFFQIVVELIHSKKDNPLLPKQPTQVAWRAGCIMR